MDNESPPSSSEQPKDSDGSTIRKALTSISFVEKTALLLITALLSGLLIPFVMTSLQRKQANNDAILNAQAKLLDDLSMTILTYETLAADVTWFKNKAAKNDEMHEKAFDRYNERVVGVVADWRALAAKSQTLVSPNVSKKIDGFLARIFLEQDTPMMTLHRNHASDEAWHQQHAKNEAMISEANKLIAEIAKDLNLTKDALDR